MGGPGSGPSKKPAARSGAQRPPNQIALMWGGAAPNAAAWAPNAWAPNAIASATASPNESVPQRVLVPVQHAVTVPLGALVVSLHVIV
jgi:hypothetical protein